MAICFLAVIYRVFLSSFISFAYRVSWPDLTCATLHSTPRENLLSLFVHGLFQVAYSSLSFLRLFPLVTPHQILWILFISFSSSFFRTFICNCFIYFFFSVLFSYVYRIINVFSLYIFSKKKSKEKDRFVFCRVRAYLEK